MGKVRAWSQLVPGTISYIGLGSHYPACITRRLRGVGQETLAACTLFDAEPWTDL